jgi:hypothetical protein
MCEALKGVDSHLLRPGLVLELKEALQAVLDTLPQDMADDPAVHRAKMILARF